LDNVQGHLDQHYYGGPDENTADRGSRNLYDPRPPSYPEFKDESLPEFGLFAQQPKYTPAYAIYGIAGAAKRQLTRKLSLSARLEWLNDNSGRVTGTAQQVKEVTLTGTYAILARLSGWLEYRHDWSNQPYFNRGNELGNWRTQPTMLVGLVAMIGPKR